MARKVKWDHSGWTSVDIRDLQTGTSFYKPKGMGFEKIGEFVSADYKARKPYNWVITMKNEQGDTVLYPCEPENFYPRFIIKKSVK